MLDMMIYSEIAIGTEIVVGTELAKILDKVFEDESGRLTIFIMQRHNNAIVVPHFLFTV